MVNPVPMSVQKAWEGCNVQVFVLLSLFLQTLLTLLAPFRKRTASLTVTAIIWLAYLLADWVASFAVGLISNSTNKDPIQTAVPDRKYDESNGDLFTFWASFLLLHLGGPDTITALALEDTALWLRQLLGLVFQVFAAAYIIMLSLPSNSLLAPTLFVLVAGIIKYAERLRALYLVSTDIVFDERVLRGKYWFNLRVRNKDETSSTAVPGAEVICLDQEPAFVICARNCYEIFRGFECNFTGRAVGMFKLIIPVLLAKNPGKAMEIISIQLNWLYQNLYTKAVVVGSKWGYAIRFASLSALIAALLLFSFTDKSNFNGVNTVITYILLGGALFLDTLSLFVLIPADWAFSEICIKRYRLGRQRWVIRFIRTYLNLRRPNWASSSARCSASSVLDWGRQIFFRRWCESVSGYNLIEYTLRESKGRERGRAFAGLLGDMYIRAVTFFGLKDLRDRLKYVFRKPLSKELWDFIVKQVIIEQDYHCRGEWSEGTMYNLSEAFVYHRLYPYDRDTGLSYEETIVRNHIATEIWYNATVDDRSMSDDTKRHREFSKALSDYMLYLLAFQPGVVSSVGLNANETRESLESVCTDANLGPKSDLGQACEKIFGATARGVVNVLGIRLIGKEVNCRDTDWDWASKCWAKILIHGAYYSKPESHARMIIGGGELVSHVWLALGLFHKRLSGASDADIEAWSREKYGLRATVPSTSGEKEKIRKGIVSSICCK